MTFRPSSRSPNTSPSARARMATVFRACATAGLVAGAAVGLVGCSGAPAAPSAGQRAKVLSAAQSRAYSNQFQWAVQAYEAGKYTEAAEKFRRLEAAGTSAPEYDLISFYLGMCQYRVGRYGPAAERLREFLRGERDGEMGQEARLALLTIYERNQDWDALLGLAAETDALPLYQENRAFLKLLWARALAAKGEVKGAAKVLEESQAYLAGDPNLAARSPDPDRDLWGRFHYTKLVLQLDECRRTQPRSVGAGKRAQRLYPAWLDAQVDCLRQSLTFLETELAFRDSAWAKGGNQAFGSEAQNFFGRVKGYYAQEKSSLPRQRALQAAARASLYRLLSVLESSSRRLTERNLPANFVDALRKDLDHLLVSLSSPT